MEVFLSVIITALLVFYVLRFAMRLVGPWLLRTFLKRFTGFDLGGGSEEVKGGRGDQETLAVKTDDGLVLRPRLHEGQRISDKLGYEYADVEEVLEG